MSMIRLFEMFSGYGGASFGLKKANIDFECIGISEIDKYAIQCFNNNFPNINNFGDCTKINPNDLPDFDLLTGGFPCQSFSIAGKRKGINDSRGTLFYDIIRIAQIKKPKYMLLENVKGLLSIDNGETFKEMIKELKNIGYDVIYKVLNSKDYGIPQSRERIWIVCKYGKWDFMEFQFPNKEELKIFVKDLLERDVDKKYNLSEKQIKVIEERLNFKGGNYKDGGKRIKIDRIQFDISGKGYNSQQDRVYNADGIMACLPNANPDNKINIFLLSGLQEHQSVKEDGISNALPSAMGMGGGHTPVLLIDPKTKKGHNQVSPTLRSGIGSGNKFQVTNNYIFRRLIPKECFRLMGFLNDEINLDNLSDTQKYKLAGNGWEINIVSKIFKELFKNVERKQ